MSDAELVAAAIRASGLSAERWADREGVNRRTVFRWLSGASRVRDRQRRAQLEEQAAAGLTTPTPA